MQLGEAVELEEAEVLDKATEVEEMEFCTPLPPPPLVYVPPPPRARRRRNRPERTLPPPSLA